MENEYNKHKDGETHRVNQIAMNSIKIKKWEICSNTLLFRNPLVMASTATESY
jgi:hypothetical protein